MSQPQINIHSFKEEVKPMQRDFDNKLQYNGFWVGKPEDNVAVIIDGSYLTHVSRHTFRGGVDFKVLSHIFYANFPGLRCMQYFITEIFRETDDPKYRYGQSNIRGRLLWMKNNRYTVFPHPVYVSKEEEINYQSLETMMDVQITTSLYKAARFADHIVFIGGNRKFIDPLMDLKSIGKTITVVGTKRTEPVAHDPKAVIDELRQIDNFVDLEDPFFKQIITNNAPLIANRTPNDQDPAVETEEEAVETADQGQ